MRFHFRNSDISPAVWGMTALYWVMIGIFIIVLAWRVMTYEAEQSVDGLWRGEHQPGELPGRED